VDKNETKKTGITKKGSKNRTLDDKLPKNQGEWLELVIFFTERALSRPGGKQPYLLKQLDKLKEELKEWRTKNER
jgi:hypothetical protein